MHGRCGPLCQHPGCWESDRPGRHSRKYNSRYIEQLLRHRTWSTSTPQPREPVVDVSSRDSGLPVLTVQSLAVEELSARRHTENTTPVVSTASHTPPSPAPPPQLHNVQVLLETVRFSHSSPLSFSPVLIWMPGRLPVRPTPPPSSRGEGRGKECVTVKTQDLIGALPPQRPTQSLREKARLHSTRPRSRPDHDSVDLLQDIPHYIVTEILQQLQSDSTSTLHPPTPPHPQHTPTAPLTPTHHTTQPEQRPSHPPSSHIPHSLVCDLSTGQIYSTGDTTTTIPTRTRVRPRTPTHQHHQPPPPPPHPPNTAKKDVSHAKQKRIVAQCSKKTSFSRALSESPMAVLRKIEPVPSKKHPPLPPPPLPSIHTLEHALLPPHPTRAKPPSTHRHSHTRYPLGNPTVPRIPHEISPNPLFAPYHKIPASSERPQNVMFLRMSPAHIHNARLVTLHTLSTAHNTPPSPVHHAPTHSEETPPGINENTATVHLPPIPPSPSPPHSCVSPDHMHMGAEILGDQLVLDREGEQVVHPLQDPSQSSVGPGGASKSDTTPSSVGVVNGSQAPPPTAQS